MKKNVLSSLIISTYNWPKALELVLLSVKNQTVFPDEIIVADDGSNDDTKELIENFKKQFPVPLLHVWHKDEGFKKSEILNKAIVKSSGDYIIQIDGDCILHHNFVADHLKLAEHNTYLFGSRVNIQEKHINALFNEKQIRFNMFSKGINKRTRALYIPFLSRFYKAKNKFSKKYRGCNTSYFKKDTIAVNGYNENFSGWGREDSEFALRLMNNGIKAKRIRYRGIVYHIYHKIKSKNRLKINDVIEKNTINNKLTWSKNGIDKYLNEK